MLPKGRKLNLKKDFRWVASGQKLENNLVKLFMKYGDPSTALRTNPKVGIATSKSTFRKAVLRNRARRLISKGFENLYGKLPKGVNIVALPKQKVVELSSDQITKSLEELLKKGKILDENNSY